MRKSFVLLLLLLSACASGTRENDQAKAETTMRSFFHALAIGRYQDAAALYGGEYETLTGWNPSLDPADLETLWQHGCESNGLVCMAVRDVVRLEQAGEGYQFTVTFEAKDGGLFEFTGCCGESLPESIKEWDILVIRDGDEFRTATMPPYVP